MKIGFINYLPSKNNSDGVLKKIKGMAKAAINLNLDIDFLILNMSESRQENNLKLIKIDLPKNKYLSFIKRFYFKYRIIEKHVNLDEYDKIVLRYPMSNDLIFYKKFFQNYGDKIFLHHNSNELNELKTNTTLWGKMNYFLEKQNSPKVFAKIAGIIAITDELRMVELNKTILSKSSTIVSNGIDVENTPFTKFSAFDNKTLKLIFVAAVFSPWHGLDRLISGIEEYKGKTHIQLTIVGKINNNDTKRVKDLKKRGITIKCMGKLLGDPLDNEFAQANIAVSSLALYRNKMNEGSVLKTSEYIARGIPFIYAYHDTDIPNEVDFGLKFENNHTSVDLAQVITFAQKFSSNKNISQIMRDYATEKLDWKIKIKQLYNFLESENN